MRLLPVDDFHAVLRGDAPVVAEVELVDLDVEALPIGLPALRPLRQNSISFMLSTMCLIPCRGVRPDGPVIRWFHQRPPRPEHNA